jgi:3-hydroxymyristoyl/3-hydroxydecanoyl-(acyl carrier protein) dehydratase
MPEYAVSPAFAAPASSNAGSAAITSRICVSAPYFALEGLREVEVGGPGAVAAGVRVEADPGRQAAVIGCAEVGRHLAILGLCAAATVNPAANRHFYLARRARIDWLAGAAAGGVGGLLMGRARAAFTGRRAATARALLEDREGKVARAVVDYDVLSAPLFVRAFGSAPAPSLPTGNPYRDPMPLSGITADRIGARGTLDVTADLCPGHFDERPMLPVAMVGAAMTDLIDHAVTVLSADPGVRWLPAIVEIEASRFAPAGSQVDFELVLRAGRTTSVGFTCAARIGADVIATGDIDISLLPAVGTRH